jgi:hypothetical protein
VKVSRYFSLPFVVELISLFWQDSWQKHGKEQAHQVLA